MKKGNSYNWILPDIETLKDLYFNEKMSLKQIARKYKVTPGAVRIKLYRYGITLRTMSEGQALISNYVSITPELNDFINGLLLGDGSIILAGNKKSCWYGHSDKNKDYLKWLRKEFLLFGIECSDIKKHTNNSWSIKTKSYRDFVEIRNIWYPEGRKKIPSIQLTPITLFNWYIGDGSYDKKSKGEKVVICSMFDPAGKIEMNEQLNSMGIETSIYPESIYIKKESRDAFFEYMLDHNYDIPRCYKYKFSEEIWV